MNIEVYLAFQIKDNTVNFEKSFILYHLINYSLQATLTFDDHF